MSVTPLCIDEDLLIRDSAATVLLRPAGVRFAAGSDGRFATGERWVLRSASNDFLAQGCVEGQIVALWDDENTERFGPEGEPFLVDAGVTSEELPLRRVATATGLGLPPAPAGGLSPVRFVVFSYAAQIEEASYRIGQRYAIDDLLAGRTTSELEDPRQVRELCVLTALQRACIGNWLKAHDDLWKERAGMFKEEMVFMATGLRLRFRDEVGGTTTVTGSAVKISR